MIRSIILTVFFPPLVSIFSCMLLKVCVLAYWKVVRANRILSFCQMAWGLGLEPRFSDSKSDVLPIRRPPNTDKFEARNPKLETISNNKNECYKQIRFGLEFWISISNFWKLIRISIFEFRIWTFKHSTSLAWGPGVEPGFSDPESDVLPIRRSPKSKSPSRSMATGALFQKADHRLPSTYVKAGYIVCCWKNFILPKIMSLSHRCNIGWSPPCGWQSALGV